jgi:mono/diheme cytochrome c family protein
VDLRFLLALAESERVLYLSTISWLIELYRGFLSMRQSRNWIGLSLAIISIGLTGLIAGEPQKVPADKVHSEQMARSSAIFAEKVRPIFLQHCFDCHGGKKVESEFDMTERSGLLKGGDAGVAVIPGDAKKSIMFRMVNHTKKPAMPYELPKLPQAQIDTIAEWIDLGAAYDRPLLDKKDAVAWQTKKIPPEARQHWAFKPLQVQPSPKIQNSMWVKNAIDPWVLSKLEEKGITPNPTTSKHHLLRRAHMDVIGLPPTPEEAKAFLEDPSPDAYPKLIDRLLHSQHFGERWARHWLDLARFAESHGFEHDYDRPSAYHYRDFVIQAFNQDLPYKTFVEWQLAGDEKAPKNPLALMATGFLAAGVHSTQITANEVEKHRYDEMDDMASTTATAFLGLTVGCARCHDHKFDPIPAGDYYRLLSTFTSTIRAEVDLNLDPEVDRKTRVQFEQTHAPLVRNLENYEQQQLPVKLAEWESKRKNQPIIPAWQIPEIREMKSNGGATLTKQADGSILITGKNPDHEKLMFQVVPATKSYMAIRIEALTHPTLVKNGPGRAANGNFALSDLQVFVNSVDGKKSTPIRLKNPRSTFDQASLGVANVIDSDPKGTGWAVDPQFGKDHAASFEFESAQIVPEGGSLTVVMQFNINTGHGMGRPRISLANQSLPLQAKTEPEQIETILAIPREKRSCEQTATLLKALAPSDPEWSRLNAIVQEHSKLAPKPAITKVLVASEGLQAVRLHTQGGDLLPETHFLKRGDPQQKDGVATPGYLQVLLSPEQDGRRWTKAIPPSSQLSYRRSALADWLTDTEHGAGQLLARVIVNRIWQHYIGRGIVATPSDFGLRGEKPSHPELLDFLATELIRNDWKLKSIHRLILTSAVYQQSSITDEERLKMDRENSMLWHHPVRRLEAEAIRDSLLAVSGTLDDRMLGPGTLDESSHRRSIYFTVKRSRLIPSLTIFDAPDGTVGLGDRPATTIAPQALHLMNNPQVRAYANGLANRMKQGKSDSLPEIIDRGYWLTVARAATVQEKAEGIAFIEAQMKTYPESQRMLAITDYAQILLCLNEFLFIE